VVHYVPVPLGGIEDEATLRALFDLDSWIRGTCLNPGAQLVGAREVFWKIVSGAGVGGGRACNCGRVYPLPSSPANPRKKIFKSPPISPALLVKLDPLGKRKKNNWLGPSLSHWVCTMGLGWM
jgi:hypothetical protein